MCDYMESKEKLSNVLRDTNDLYNYYVAYSGLSGMSFYDIITKIINNKKCLGSNDKGHIVYVRDEKDIKNNMKNISTTLSRYIRRVVGIDSSYISDSDLEMFQLAFNLRYNCNDNSLLSNISIVNGDKIVEGYRDSLIGSCMTGSRSYLVEFYAVNPDKVSLVLLDKAARALLWNTSEGKVLDKIYGPPFARCILRKWAEDKGYKLNEEIIRDRLKILINMKMTENKLVPYMDTFRVGMLLNDRTHVILSHVYNNINSLDNYKRENHIILNSECGGYSHYW